MAMGRRQHRERQENLWVTHTELVSTLGHPFYERLNTVLDAESFYRYVESPVHKILCASVREPVAYAGDLLPLAVDRLLQGQLPESYQGRGRS